MRKDLHFLPAFSLPYTHYSLLARCQALLRRFVEHCSWENAAPKFEDADRVPDSTTLRRWSQGVDESQPLHSFSRKISARRLRERRNGRNLVIRIRTQRSSYRG